MATPKVFTNKLNTPVYLRIFEDGVQKTQESIAALASYTYIPSHEHAVVVFLTPEGDVEAQDSPKSADLTFQTKQDVETPPSPDTAPIIPLEQDPNNTPPAPADSKKDELPL
jgi:hypothetical protein